MNHWLGNRLGHLDGVQTSATITCEDCLMDLWTWRGGTPEAIAAWKKGELVAGEFDGQICDAPGPVDPKGNERLCCMAKGHSQPEHWCRGWWPSRPESASGATGGTTDQWDETPHVQGA